MGGSPTIALVNSIANPAGSWAPACGRLQRRCQDALMGALAAGMVVMGGCDLAGFAVYFHSENR
jgi:hypothetical protein